MRARQFLFSWACCILTVAITFGAPRPDRAAMARLKRTALPQFADALGWNQSMYYETIQTADIDGDGQTELLARWIDGLHIYTFDDGVLVRHSHLAKLSDAAGFSNPSWYSTIQTAVLDPASRQADILARMSDGIHVYRYDKSQKIWCELGASASFRPFSDAEVPSIDLAEYYRTIHAGDLTKDGVAELVGRTSNGMAAYSWDSSSESWVPLGGAVDLPNVPVEERTKFANSMRLIDLDADGAAELVTRTSGGVQTYKWMGSGWSPFGERGPFEDAVFADSKSGQFASVRASVDAAKRVWVYGIVPGKSGARSGAIQIYHWKNGKFQQVQTIDLPGDGWDQPGQYLTLSAADIQGDDTPEFLVRGRDGLHAFTAKGEPLPTHLRSFNDAQGWNRPQQYWTIRTAWAKLATQNGSTMRPVILGRGKTGIEAYTFSGRWVAAASSDFPNFCLSSVSQSCTAYQAISLSASGHRTNDLRTLYGENSNETSTWLSNIALDVTVNKTLPPPGVAHALFEDTLNQLRTEFGYIDSVHNWFNNNSAVMMSGYNGSANTLADVYSKVTLSSAGGSNASVILKWVNFALDLINEISGAIGQEEVSTVSGILAAVLDATVTATENSEGGSEVQKAYGELSQLMEDQTKTFDTANGDSQTMYLTSYDKLKQIGLDTTTGGFDWGTATPKQLGDAEAATSVGLKKFFYKPLASASWKVWACAPNHAWPWGGCLADASAYDTNLNCLYDYRSDGWPYQYVLTSYIVLKNGWKYPDWDALKEITGTDSNALNLQWYMMILGGNLDWDLATPDPYLPYGNIQYGYTGVSSDVDGHHSDNNRTAGCGGYGSSTGIVSPGATIGARLSQAQAVTQRISAEAALALLEQFRYLRRVTVEASPDSEVRKRLLPPLREAIASIRKVRDPLPPEQADFNVSRSVSASSAVKFLQSYIQRVQGNAHAIGLAEANQLTAAAYDILQEIEGTKEAAVKPLP